MGVDRGDGRKWQSYRGWKDEKGPGSDAPPEQGGSDPRVLTSIESPHYQNFVDAVRAEDEQAADLRHPRRAPTATLPQLANIAYRAGRQLTFDGKTETFVNDKEADRCSRASTPRASRSAARCRTDHPARWAVAPAPTAHRHSFNAPSIGNVSPLHARRAVHGSGGRVQNGSSGGRPKGRNTPAHR